MILKEYLDPDPKNFELVSHKYSNYRVDPTKTNNTWKDRDIKLSNLVEKIDALSPCLHHLINYNELDLRPSKTPLVLSRYDVVHVMYKTTTARAHKLDFIDWKRTFPFEKVPATKNSSGLEWCQRRSRMYDLECFDIPIEDHTPKTKPWRCEVHWYLFPPIPIKDQMFYNIDPKFNPSSPPLVEMIIPAAYKKFWTFNLNKGFNESETP